MARLEQASKFIAKSLGVPNCDKPDIDVFGMVCEWLGEEFHGLWLLVLDNADDMNMFFNPSIKSSQTPNSLPKPLFEYLSNSKNVL